MSSVPTQNATNQVAANQTNKTSRFDKFNHGQEKQGDAFASMLSGLKKNLAASYTGNVGGKRAGSSSDMLAQQIVEQRQDAIDAQKEREEEDKKKRIAQERREEAIERQEELDKAQDEEDLSKMAVNMLGTSQSNSPFARLMSSLASSGTAGGSSGGTNSGANPSATTLAQSGSTANTVNGYAVATPDEQGAKAASLMSQVSDDSIEANLNQINFKNLSTAPQNPIQSLSERLSSMDNADLRQNLDTLAKANSVSKLSLQMANPQTQAQERSNAAAIYNMPTSGNQLAALGGSASPASGPTSTPKTTNHVSTETLIKFRQNQQSMTGANEAQGNTKSQSAKALLEMTSGTKSMNADEIAKLTTQKQQHGATLSDDHAGAATRATNTSAVSVGANVSSMEQALASLRQSSGQQQNVTQGFNPQAFAKGQDSLSVEALGSQSAQNNAAGDFGSQSQGFTSDSGLNNNLSQVAQSQTAQSQAALSQTQSGQHAEPSGSAHSSMYLSSNASENADEIHEKVMQMAARNLKQLSVDLSPNNLGRMRIEISLDKSNDALSVSLAAMSQQTREALEQALPKLRETLAQQNILADEHVYDLADMIADSDMAEHGQGESNSNAGHNAQTANEFFAQRQRLQNGLNISSQAGGIEFAKSGLNEVVADKLTDNYTTAKLSEATQGSTKSDLNLFA